MNNTTTTSPFLSQGVITPEPKYLRPAQAAHRISVTQSTIYKLLKAGSLRSHKLGKNRLIKVSDLDQLVESNA